MRLLPALLLAAVACSNGAATRSGLTPAPATPAATTTTPAPVTSRVTAPVSQDSGFRSPSGNVGCWVTTTAASCDAPGHTWTSPPKPSGCEGDEGSAVQVLAGPPARVEVLDCQSDTPYDAAAPVLGYGDKVVVGPFVCESRTDGVRCTHVPSGKGFRLSRESYDVF